ncbi:MAG: alkaline phosphatase family protein [Chloroflexi bacterium]|nr:alkaline phosphatase family protein [Chloroflexota bacterium]
MSPTGVGDVPRLLAAFEDGSLIRPDAAVANTVDLARALAVLCGVKGQEVGPNARRIAEVIGEHEHLVFVLIDGLGMNLVEREGPDEFLRAHTVMELRSVFPSSTAPALTSIATGLWPGEHGVPGWWTYLPAYGLTATVLPFIERFSKKDARAYGVTPDVAFPGVALGPRMTRQQLRVMPKRIHGSVYSRYSSGDAPSFGYGSLRAGVEAACAFIERATEPTWTYLYAPFVDTAEHEHGIDSKGVRRAMKLVRSRVEMLTERLRGRARIVLTADHGQIDVPPGQQTELRESDPLLRLLRVPPSCEPRTPAFHAAAGKHTEFERVFRERFAGQFALLTTDEADDLCLFGPARMSDGTRRRLGDYVGIALRSYTVSLPLETAMIGFHGGLHPDEVRVPLVLV